MTYETKICTVCGQPVEQPIRGRPREYHDPCRKYHQLMGWLTDLIDDINPTHDAIKDMRGELWGLANILNAKKSNHKKGEMNMGEVKYEIKTFKISYMCDICGSGEMRLTTEWLPHIPTRCPHQCTECGETATFGEKYPKTINEPVRTITTITKPNGILCQECFKNEATMQNNEGTYTCSNCYQDND